MPQAASSMTSMTSTTSTPTPTAPAPMSSAPNLSPPDKYRGAVVEVGPPPPHRTQTPTSPLLPSFPHAAAPSDTLAFFCDRPAGPPAAARVRAPAGRGHSRAIELVYELEDEQTSALAPLRGLVGSSGRRRSVKDRCEEALDDAVFCSRDRCDWRATADVSEMLRCQCSCTLMESMHRRMVSENLFCIHIHFFSRQCESRTIGGDECPCTLTPPRWADPTQAQLALYMA